MATKKFKNDVLFETLSNGSSEVRIPTVDQFGQLAISGSITETDLNQLASLSTDYVAESQRGAANGFVPLDANQKIASGYLPALAITDVYSAADLAARDALSTSAIGARITISVQSGPLTADNPAASGAELTFDGVTFTSGTDWTVTENDGGATANSIRDAINNSVHATKYSASTVGNDVTIEAIGAIAGDLANGTSITTNDANDKLFLQNFAYGGSDSLTASGTSSFVGGSNGIQEGDVVRVADASVHASAIADLTSDISFQYASGGAANNDNTVTFQVEAAAANATDEILIVVSGT